MRNAHRLAVLLVLGLAHAVTPVRAQTTDNGARPLDVRVGQTVVVDVGYGRGIQCDDVTIILPELRPHDWSSNWFYVTGRSPGTTFCRTGLFDGPVYLFRITVHP